MERDPFNMDAFEASLEQFRANIRKANDARKDAPDDESEDEEAGSYSDLDETSSATGKAIKNTLL